MGSERNVGPLLQTFENEIHAKALAAFHAEAVGPNVVLLLRAFLLPVVIRPLDRHAMVAGERFHPLLVFVGPLGQGLLGDGTNPLHIAEEVNDVRGTRQQREISLNDDAIKTVVYKNQQASKQLAKRFHRSLPVFCRQPHHHIIGQRPMEIQDPAP